MAILYIIIYKIHFYCVAWWLRYYLFLDVRFGVSKVKFKTLYRRCAPSVAHIHRVKRSVKLQENLNQASSLGTPQALVVGAPTVWRKVVAVVGDQ